MPVGPMLALDNHPLSEAWPLGRVPYMSGLSHITVAVPLAALLISFKQACGLGQINEQFARV